MNKLIPTVVLLSLAAGPALSAAGEPDDPYRNTKVGIVFGNAIAGTIIAGPIGGAVAAVAGIWTGNKVAEGYEKQAVEQELAGVSEQNAMMRSQLAQLNAENSDLQSLASTSLEFQVLFHTGDGELAADNQQRIERLAGFLARQQGLNVQLSGYADPRGDAAYNEALSQSRVDSIAELLVANGVPEARIVTAAYGDQLSAAAEGDYDAYALERRVSIELVPVVDSTSVAATF